MRPPVLVVGAGPVGLLTAVLLQRHRVPVQVLERRLHQPHPSRASTFQPPVLDRLEAIGLLQDLAPLGRRVHGITAWDLELQRRAELSLQSLASCTAHPYRLHLEQRHLIAALERCLEKTSPGCLHRGLEVSGCDVASLDVGAAAAAVVATDSSGSEHVFRGSWLVAADGAHSVLRQSAGLAFFGDACPAPVVRLYLTELPPSLSAQLAGLTYLRRGHRTMSCLQMAQGWRFILRPSSAEVDAALADTFNASPWSLECLQGMFEGLVEPDLWLTMQILQDHYAVAQRQISSHCRGRLLLVGDAAHITNTRGGLNMNFGLLEAWDLAEAIALWWHQRPGVDPISRWADGWQQRMDDVLMPRTAQMSGAGTIFARADAVSSAERQQWLRQATLLDLVGQP